LFFFPIISLQSKISKPDPLNKGIISALFIDYLPSFVAKGIITARNHFFSPLCPQGNEEIAIF